MRKVVLINVPFKDVYTGERYVAGKTTEMTDERIKEVKEVDPNFITVIGIVKEEAGINNPKMGQTENDVSDEDIVDEIISDDEDISEEEVSELTKTKKGKSK